MEYQLILIIVILVVTVINNELYSLRKERLHLQNGNAELQVAITNIAHDIRTPLTAISGCLELLDQEELPALVIPTWLFIWIDIVYYSVYVTLYRFEVQCYRGTYCGHNCGDSRKLQYQIYQYYKIIQVAYLKKSIRMQGH